jgi:hypothetical protein
VASEILKSQVHRGARRELFHFRDQQGLEVDFLIPGKQGSVTLVEVKATRTVKPAMAEPLLRLGAAWKGAVRREGRAAGGDSPRESSSGCIPRARSGRASPVAPGFCRCDERDSRFRSPSGRVKTE